MSQAGQSTLANIPVEAQPAYWHRRHNPRAFSFWSLFVPVGEDVTNLAVNGSAEINLDRWSVIDPFLVNLTRETNQVHTGGFSVCATANNPQSIVVLYDMTNEWVDNTEYTVCVSVFGPGGITAGLDTTNLTDSTTFGSSPFMAPCRNTDRQSNRTVLDGLNWHRLCMRIPAQILAPGNDAVIAFQFGEIPETTVGPVYIDSLVIVEGRRELEYFDGNTVGGQWNGAENASTSTLSRFSTASGEKFYLSELGLDIYSDAGWGMPPQDLVTRNFARFDGAELKRLRNLPRTISISGIVENCTLEMHERRCALIKALSYRFDNICPQEILLGYQLIDSCGTPITKELVIPVKYRSGLEGLRTSLDNERINLQLIANTQPLWRETNENSILPVQNGLTQVNYEGTAPAPIIIEFRAGPVADMRIFEVENQISNAQVIFIDPDNGGIAGKPIIAGRSNIIDTTPGSFEFYTPNATFPDQLRFIDYINSDISLLNLVQGNNQMYLEWQGADSEVVMHWYNYHYSVDCAPTLDSAECC